MSGCQVVYDWSASDLVRSAHENIVPQGLAAYDAAKQFAVQLSAFAAEIPRVNFEYQYQPPGAGNEFQRPNRPNFTGDLEYHAPDSPQNAPQFTASGTQDEPYAEFDVADPGEFNPGIEPTPLSLLPPGPAPVLPDRDDPVRPPITTPEDLSLGSAYQPNWQPLVYPPDLGNFGGVGEPEKPSDGLDIDPFDACSGADRPGPWDDPTLLPTPSFDNIPPPPPIVIPAFTAVAPVASPLPDIVDNWSFAPGQYVPTLMPDLVAEIQRGLVGGTGVPAAVRNALLARLSTKVDIEETRIVRQTIDEFCTRGFTEPNGILAGRLNEVRQASQSQRNAVARDQYIADSELEQKHLQFCITQGLALESVLIDLFIRMQTLELQASQFLLDAAVKVFEVRASQLRLAYEIYSVEASVFKTRVEAEIAKANLYEAQVRGYAAKIGAESGVYQAHSGVQIDKYRAITGAETSLYQADISKIGAEAGAYSTEMSARVSKYTTEQRIALDEFQVKANAKVSVHGMDVDVWRAKFTGAIEKYRADVAAEMDKGKLDGDVKDREVRIYEAKLKGINALVEVYNSEVRAFAERLRADTATLDAFRAEVQAYEATVGAKTAEWGGYRARIDAETAKLGAYEVGVRAYSARISTTTEKNRGKLARDEMRLREHEANLRTYQADLQRIGSMMQAEQARVQAVAAKYGAQATVYQADGSIEQAASASYDRRYSLDIQSAAAQAQVAVQNGQIAVQENVQVTGLQLEALKSATQVLSQIAAGLTSSLNYSTSLGYSQQSGTSCNNNYSFEGN